MPRHNRNQQQSFSPELTAVLAQNAQMMGMIKDQGQTIVSLGLQVKKLTIEVNLLKVQNAELRADNAELRADNAELRAEVAELKLENQELKARTAVLEERIYKLESRLGIIEKLIPVEKIHELAEEALGSDYLEQITSETYTQERHADAVCNPDNFYSVAVIAKNLGLNVGKNNDVETKTLAITNLGREVKRFFEVATGLTPEKFGNSYKYWSWIEYDIVALILKQIYTVVFAEI